MPQKNPVQTEQQSPQKMPQQKHSQKQDAEGAMQGAAEEAPKPAKKHHKKHDDTPLGRILYRVDVFGRLLLFVGLGALLGAVIDGRGWHRYFASSLGRLGSFAKLPAIVSMAAPVAITSAPAADSMLVAGHKKGALSQASLVAGGMLNSFLAHFSHSMRIFYPVVAAIGLPGLIFFLIQFGGMALFLLAVFVWHRVKMKDMGSCAQTAAPQDMAAPSITPWKETLKNGLLRACNLVFRLVCISLPLILLMEWCLNAGLLNFWDRLVPEAVSDLIPEQLLTILAAQIGGLVPSSAICAGLKAQGLITNAQILLAMLIASAVTNPLRTLRRNLPSALAIFPAKTACTIVLSMQLVRIVIMLGAAVLVLVWMKAGLA